MVFREIWNLGWFSFWSVIGRGVGGEVFEDCWFFIWGLFLCIYSIVVVGRFRVVVVG